MNGNGTAEMPGCRVLFCTYPSIYSSLVLAIVSACPRIEIIGIVESTRLKRRQVGYLRSVIEILRLSGLSYAIYLLFVSTLWSLLGRLPTVSDFARVKAIPLHKTADINAAESLAFARAQKPDVLLCAHFNQLLGDEALHIAARQALNIHPSSLPDYRGFDPVFFAMANREAVMGVSLHLMDRVFDEGELLAVSELDVDKNDSLLANNLRLFAEGARLAVSYLGADSEGLVSQAQSGEGSYVGWPKRAEVRAFRRDGHRLWRLSDLRPARY